MPYAVHTEQRGPHEVVVVEGPESRAEIWPGLGFNCLTWQIRSGDTWGDLLYQAPDWATNPVPTRSGHPVLFPFPNRLKGAEYTFNGVTYHLPKTESTKTHAIHGFTPRNPWRVTQLDPGPDFASVTGEFRLSADAPADRPHWPADATLTLTYRLSAAALRVEAAVHAAADPLPFGLGYHPYFTLPSAPGETCDDWLISTTARTLWPAENSLATGEQVTPPHEWDLRDEQPVGPRSFDHLYGQVRGAAEPADGLATAATLAHPRRPGRLLVCVGPDFRELLVFTPAHRHAVALEPYTCTTDAAHFAERGIDAGWRVLPPGERWHGVVEYRWTRDE